MTISDYGHVTLSVRISLLLLCVLTCLPSKAQNKTAARPISIGVITSYFGRHPKLQSFAERLVDHLVSSAATAQEVLLIPYENEPGQAVQVTQGTVASSFPKTHFQGGGDGHDNEGAMGHLAELGNPWILISNGPSVSDGRRLKGSTRNKLFAKVLQVRDGRFTLYVYFSELGLEKLSNLAALPQSSNIDFVKEDESAIALRTSTNQSSYYVVISCVALVCVITTLQYNYVSKKVAAISERMLDVVSSSEALMVEVSSLQQKMQVLVENANVRKDVDADNDRFNSHRLDTLLELASTSQSNNVELHEITMHKVAEIMDSLTEQRSQILVNLDNLTRRSTRDAAGAPIQSDSKIDEAILLLETLTRDSNEVTNLRQSLAEQVADVKKLDESVLSFASLLFRLSSQSEPSDLDQDTASYILGRLVRYFERVGINVIVPRIGDAFIDELHSIHSTVPATDDAEHMNIVDVHEIGLRRGSHVLRTASVTIAIGNGR